MALQLSFDDQFGSTHASAYHRILMLHMDVDVRIAEWVVGIYKDAAARADGKMVLTKRAYALRGDDFDTYLAPDVLDIEDQNPQERLYVYLKTLDEYDGASDV